ncbi:DUF2968 domain-containing protein [Burkholderia glumae]|uniref:DUF2968 domain-containing protein n=2 Tax=Burkholderia glumae TaxID=337 RepID=UPI000F5E0C25|nr:DUF2968 domain-containing protein [Burkholderia glumae]MCQ0029348.1 DUF2968 domain-containing protein [Burkholderia glumae]RQZ73810.1 DUF2968 domain-containing protein [Burkholderia glumae]UVS83617.1 DUF2968 domain-containing protein [Burkholderia glumae]
MSTRSRIARFIGQALPGAALAAFAICGVHAPAAEAGVTAGAAPAAATVPPAPPRPAADRPAAADMAPLPDSVPPVAGTRPDVTTLTPGEGAGPGGTSPLAADDAQGSVAELMGMLRDHQLTELRTTYNGSYGASLLFYPREMTYYVALFQDKHFWRVVKSQERPRAEMIYQNFVDQTVQLSDIELRRTELAAQKQFLERVIGLSEDRAKRLRADLKIAREQQAQIEARQRAAQDQARALAVEQRAAAAQLHELQRRVQRLQQENGLGPDAP